MIAAAKGPVQAGVERNSTPEGVVATLNSMLEDGTRLAVSFPGDAEPVTFDNMAIAIEFHSGGVWTLETAVATRPAWNPDRRL